MREFDKNQVAERKERLYQGYSKEIKKLEKRIGKYQAKDRNETPTTIVIKKYKKHKLAVVFLWILVFFYVCMLFSGFLAPYSGQYKFKKLPYIPPSKIHFFDEKGKWFGPYVYEYKLYNIIYKKYQKIVDKVEFVNGKEIKIYKKDRIGLFVQGEPYKLLGMIPAKVHLFGLKGSYNAQRKEFSSGIFLFGTDGIGRDIFSRVLHGTWVSLSVGIVGTFISMVLALILGGIAGYFGGRIDWFIMRVCEIIILFPGFYLLLFLRSLIPHNIPPSQQYFLIVIILSVIGFAGLTRVVRGFFLSLKNEDYVLAAQAQGINQGRIIFRHILPQLSSYLIVSASLGIPGYILGETGLSFLGLGISEPSVSWGMLLAETNNPNNVTYFPWILIPSIFIILTVMAFNMIGDGLRDALDPRTKI